MRCWSCGAPVSGSRFVFTCPNCAQVEQLQELRREASRHAANLEEIQERGFEVLAGRLSEVSTVLEWGFDQLRWQLEQQTGTLLSIDQTLKTPGETQANEWRRMAEELRKRGDLPGALEFFLKAKQSNPLDYRTYVGAGYTYLTLGGVEKATEMLQSSLIHAPSDYYRAYSRRLLGHVHACQEDYVQAEAELSLAVTLASDYVDARYDHAQYCALIGNHVGCLHSLETAVAKGGARYFRLAQSEQNFAPFRDQVTELLQRFYQKARAEAQLALTDAESELRKADQSLTAAETSYHDCRRRIHSTPDVSLLTLRAGEYEQALGMISVARTWMARQDYAILSKVRDHAQESLFIAQRVRQKADGIQKDCTSRIADHDAAESRKGIQALLALMTLIVMFIVVGECGSRDPDLALSTGDSARPPQPTISPRTQSPIPTAAPTTLKWHTFLGGVGDDSSGCIAAGTDGSFYVVGDSDASWGSPQRAYEGDWDVSVTKLDCDGNLSWHTFLGGNARDGVQSVATDESGCVYVVGESYDSWENPVEAYHGDRDAFVAKLWSEDGSLIWLTFLGGSAADEALSVAVDISGSIYVAGFSGETWGLPIHQHREDADAFVAKLDTDGHLLWHTFVGGSGSQGARSLDVDVNGCSYIAGHTDASWGSPVQAYSGHHDGFAAKLDAVGNLVWITFVGSDADDFANAVDVDDQGSIYLCGESWGAWGSPVRSFHGERGQAFVAELDNDGSIVWHTFLGGGDICVAEAAVRGKDGKIYVGGRSFAAWGSPVLEYAGGNNDAFLAKLDGEGNVVWHAFLGGSESDMGYGLAVDHNDCVCLCGVSSEGWGSPRRTFSGGKWDGFVARLA